MMVDGKLYIDLHGYPRATYSSPHELLGWYLEEEIQGSCATCDLILSFCCEVESGIKEQWRGTGNAHTVTIEFEKVTIENEFDADVKPCTVSLDDFREALKAWKKLVESNFSSKYDG